MALTFKERQVRQILVFDTQRIERISRYPWTPWKYEDDNLTVAPAVASLGANSLDVFVQGENRHLWQKRWDGSAWSAWSEVDGGRLNLSAGGELGAYNRTTGVWEGSTSARFEPKWTGGDPSNLRETIAHELDILRPLESLGLVVHGHQYHHGWQRLL